MSDVTAYETMKLRMLNGSHSTIAYLGYLAGYEYVNEVIAERSFHTLIHDLMTQEVMSTLPPDIGNPKIYRDALLERFANPALKHRTWQIAMDGSQKLPQRLLGTIRDRLATGLPISRLTLGVAAWIRYVMGRDEQGGEIEVKDPLAARLRMIADSAGDDPGKLVNGMLNVREVFGDDLPATGVFRRLLTEHLALLLEHKVLFTVHKINGQ